MNYDSAIPIAVFLGPTLSLAQAKDILKANYYPPIRMGDIYCLLATNVKVIVIIDGFFHANIPVWQREILTALKLGISVIGAASMGALRALELAPYGMIGVGEVYRWYDEEMIEGDDEVALLHLNSEHDFYPISEPLVNIRHTLENASRAGILSRSKSTAIQSELKQLYYGDRSYAAIFNCASFQYLSLYEQKQLELFINTRSESIKRLDAISALRYCENQARSGFPVSDSVLKPGKEIERPIEIYHRGVLSEQGALFKLQELLMLLEPDDTQKQQIISDASRRFLLLQWLKIKHLNTPDNFFKAYKKTWYQQKNISTIDLWLAGNGLILSELEQELADKAAAEWVVGQTFTDLDIFNLNEFALIKSGYPDFARRLCASAIINDWAELSGIEIPATVLQTGTDDQLLNFQLQIQGLNISESVLQQLFEMDFIAQKIIAKTPSFFGFDLWSVDRVICRELQLQGEFAKSAQQQSLIHA